MQNVYIRVKTAFIFLLVLQNIGFNVLCENSVAKVHKANLKFGWDLYKKLSSKAIDKNVFFSSVSINTALCMALAGARGDSASQMINTLHLTDIDPAALHSTVGKSINSLNKNLKNLKMNLANKIYLEQTVTLRPKFVNILKKNYHSDVGKVDFKKKFEKTRLEINKWVEEQTKKKIKDLLPLKSLNSDVKLVLVNAIYFEGLWDKQFNIALSFDGKFSKVKKDTKPLDVKFMSMRSSFKFAKHKDLGCSVLELPFKGHSSHKGSMLFILPDTVDGLKKLQSKLDAKKLKKLMKLPKKKVEVDVSIPRFKLESSFKLEKVLPKLGMVDPFDRVHADFSGIHSGLYISKVIHKSFLRVNENGATAAAATAIPVMLGSAFVPQRIKFKADHPFLVMIRLDENVIFLGDVKSPGKI